ncbi:MAG: GNAT family N-acetyltransferase [Pseudobdellovibrio sp.]
MNPLASDKILISICDSGDYKNLAQLYNQIAQEILSKAFFNWNEANALDEINSAESLVVKSADKIISFVTYRNYVDRIEISAIGTSGHHSKSGFAKAVLSQLKENAAQRKLPIWLEVHENNDSAVNLYLKNGFVVINTRKRYYQDGGNALIMVFSSM